MAAKTSPFLQPLSLPSHRVPMGPVAEVGRGENGPLDAMRGARRDAQRCAVHKQRHIHAHTPEQHAGVAR